MASLRDLLKKIGDSTTIDERIGELFRQKPLNPVVKKNIYYNPDVNRVTDAIKQAPLKFLAGVEERFKDPEGIIPRVQLQQRQANFSGRLGVLNKPLDTMNSAFNAYVNYPIQAANAMIGEPAKMVFDAGQALGVGLLDKYNKDKLQDVNFSPASKIGRVASDYPQKGLQPIKTAKAVLGGVVAPALAIQGARYPSRVVGYMGLSGVGDYISNRLGGDNNQKAIDRAILNSPNNINKAFTFSGISGVTDPILGALTKGKNLTKMAKLARYIPANIAQGFGIDIALDNYHSKGDVVSGVLVDAAFPVLGEVGSSIARSRGFKTLVKNVARFIRRNDIIKLQDVNGRTLYKKRYGGQFVSKPNEGQERVMGLIFGMEFEKDSEGNITGVKYNPTKGVIGVAAMMGAKRLDGNIIEQAGRNAGVNSKKGLNAKKFKSYISTAEEAIKAGMTQDKQVKSQLSIVKPQQDVKPAVKPLSTRDVWEKFKNIEKTVYGSITPDKSFFEKGTKSGGGVITNILRAGQEDISKKVGKLVESNNPIVRNIGRSLQGFSGGLGKTEKDVVRKAEYGGGIDYAQKIAVDTQKYVYDLVGNNRISMEKLHAVLDPELAKKNIKESDLSDAEREALSTLRLVSDFINDINFKNGFISKELWEKNRGGKYIARAYKPIDFPPEVADFLKQRKDRFDLNPFYRRKDLNDWKQENAIRDPAYLLGKRLQQTLFNNEVKNMSEKMLKSGYVSETPKAGYIKLSDSKAYGKLAGKYVRKDMLEDLRGFFFTHETVQKMYDILNWWDRNPLRRTYKQIFTVFNPAVQLGNRTSNYVFAHMSGINPITFTKNKIFAKRAIESNHPLYRRMIKDGLVGTDLTKADITEFAQKIQAQVTDRTLKQKIGSIADKFREAYGKADDIAKISAMKTWLDRGYSYEESARRVTSGFQNYRTVGFLYDLGAKIPIFGNPFVRFKADLIRLGKNSLIEHPFRVASTVMMWALFTKAMSIVSGETQEDRETRESRVGAPRIPFTNISLSVQTPFGEINSARLVGAYSYNPVGGASLRGDVSEYLPFELPEKRNIGTDPVIGPLLSVYADTDFRGKSISDPNRNKYTGRSDLTPTEQNLNRIRFLQRAYTPPFVNAFEDFVQSLRGEKDYYGRTLKPYQAGLRMFPGIKVEQYGAEQAKKARETESYFRNKEEKSIKSQIKSISEDILNGRITPEQGERRINFLQNKLGEQTKPLTYINDESLDNSNTGFLKKDFEIEYIKSDGTRGLKTVRVEMPPYPKLTGKSELDKKLISNYYSKLNTARNNTIKLYEAGKITAEQADALLTTISKKKASSGNSGGTKKRKTPKLDLVGAVRRGISQSGGSTPKLKLTKPSMVRFSTEEVRNKYLASLKKAPKLTRDIR